MKGRNGYTLVETAIQMKFKDISAKVLTRMNVIGAVFTGAATILGCVDLWMKDDVGAAIGSFIAGSAAVAGCFAAGIAVALGMTTAFPVVVAMIAIAMIGMGIYWYFKDEMDVEFLKNNPWAPNCTKIHTRLAKGQITPDEEHSTVPEWENALKTLKPYISGFCSPYVTLGTNGSAMYASILINNLMGVDPWTIILSLKAESTHVVNLSDSGEHDFDGAPMILGHRHMIGDTQEIISPGYYFFEVLLDWKQIENEVKALPQNKSTLKQIVAEIKCNMGKDYPLEDKEFFISLGKHWVNKTERGERQLSETGAGA